MADDLYSLAADLERATGAVGKMTAVVVRKSAADCERIAKAKCPVDTGALRNSIGVDIAGDGRHGSMVATIGPTMNYGPYVEFGTSRMSPEPYMGPAATAVEPGFVAAMEQLGGSIL